MGGDPVELVKALFSQTLADWPGDAFAILAEDVVFNSADGHIYVGHEGFTQWHEDQLKSAVDTAFTDPAYVNLEAGWVLVRGSVESSLRDGGKQLQPGCWLVRVREDDRVSAALYYRTEEEAREALHE